MARNKNQHFVPKSYFKPFSQGCEGNAVNLYNIKKSRPIQNASVRGQCAKSYFYGEDLQLEKLLGLFEGAYATVLRKLQISQELHDDDLYVLRSFALLQHMRTEEAIKRLQGQTHEFNNAVSNHGKVPDAPQWSADHHENMIMIMRQCAEMQGAINDLKICICVNTGKSEFITSDDPAIFTSRFLLQKKNIRSFGLGAAGACFFLPLSPQYLLMCYDGDIYTVPEKNGYFVEVEQSDVTALNELQYLRSSNNIYFSSWSLHSAVMTEFKQVEPYRPSSWGETRVYVRDLSYTHEQRYVLASSQEEAESASEAIIRQSIYHPHPKRWCSKLNFRTKPKYWFKGTGSGYMRLAYLEWEQSSRYRMSA